VKVFKIEGRARSAEYVKRAVSCYRAAADAVADGTYNQEQAAVWKEQLAEVFNRGFWDGYYLGAKMGEWSSIYGSQATRKKIYLGKVTNWFARLGVAEIKVEATDLHKGDEIIFIGNTTGILEMKVEDLRVDYEEASVAPQGRYCSVAVPLDSMPEDHVNTNPEKAPGERLHPRRGDKVFIWQ
jgi:putative protease